MIYNIKDEQHFQILADDFTISPSSTGYDLMISADGQNFTKLFTVSADTTRLVTGVSSGAYYFLDGNVGDVVVNWERECGGGGGGTAGVESINGQSGALNIKTINGNDVLGTGDIEISGTGGDYHIVTEFPESANEGTMVYLAPEGGYPIWTIVASTDYEALHYDEVVAFTDADGNPVFWIDWSGCPFAGDHYDESMRLGTGEDWTSKTVNGYKVYGRVNGANFECYAETETLTKVYEGSYSENITESEEIVPIKGSGPWLRKGTEWENREPAVLLREGKPIPATNEYTIDTASIQFSEWTNLPHLYDGDGNGLIYIEYFGGACFGGSWQYPEMLVPENEWGSYSTSKATIYAKRTATATPEAEGACFLTIRVEGDYYFAEGCSDLWTNNGEQPAILSPDEIINYKTGEPIELGADRIIVGHTVLDEATLQALIALLGN